MRYNFNAVKTKQDIVKWIRNWFDRNGENCNAIVGISGGKDSSVVAALCVEALGRDRVIGVLMPNGVQSDIDMSYKLCDFLKIKRYVFPIEEAVKGVIGSIEYAFDVSEQTRINLPPRIRMAMLYAASQTLNGRVSNNCNLSERYIGWSTRYGDDAGDFSPLSNLTCTEVIAIGRALGLPEELLTKAPSDGLCGKTDEDSFGFTYEELDKYIREGVINNVEHQEKIESLHRKNMFKQRQMPRYKCK